VLQEILAKKGLTRADYKLVPFGNTGARFAAMKDNKAVAGLLAPPVSQAAVGQGYINLADAADALGGYQGTVIGTRRDYAKSNPQVVVGVIRAYRQGLQWLKLPANKQAAIEILRAEIDGISPAAGQEAYDFLVANPKGFDPGGKLDPAGSRQVLDLRRKYGPKGKTTTDVARFIDESWFEQAAKN
jgi:ABC-type nitrate/sulfonate/bicarbonate transport system substrate-binding protein